MMPGYSRWSIPSTMSWSSSAVAVLPSKAARDARRALAVSPIRNDVLTAILTLLTIPTLHHSVAQLYCKPRRGAEVGHPLSRVREVYGNDLPSYHCAPMHDLPEAKELVEEDHRQVVILDSWPL